MGCRKDFIDKLYTYNAKRRATLKDEESKPITMSCSLDNDITMVKNSKQDIVIKNEKECVYSQDDGHLHDAEEKSKRSHIVSILSDTLFYLSIVITLGIVCIYANDPDTDVEILGYHFYNVLTNSMQSEIPQGSFIFVESVDVNTIEMGDDITFYIDENISVTHRVVGIIENYNGSSTRRFITKGVDNLSVDKDTVSADNVVGVVKMHIPYLGSVLKVIADNLLFVITLYVLVVTLPVLMKIAKKKKPIT